MTGAASRPRPPIGWPLLPLPDDQGRLNWPTLDQSVRQAIEVILRTRLREQLMRPRYGAGLADFLHQPNNKETRARIQEVVTDAIKSFETRVILDGVAVSTVQGAPSHVRVEITYRLRMNGVRDQVGVSLELGG